MTAIVKSKKNMLARAGPILRRLRAGGPTMVEVGVSTALLAAHLLKMRDDLIWHGIDPWLGRDELPEAYIATGDTHAGLDRCIAESNMQKAVDKLEPYKARATVYRMRSPHAAVEFDRNLDLVFLDGDHSYEGTLADLRAWWAKLLPGGYLGGHDYANPDPRFRFGVEQAVMEFAKEIGQKPWLDHGLTFWFVRP